jgi:hypothetical protein
VASKLNRFNNMKKTKILVLAATVALTAATASANTITPQLIAFSPGSSITYGADLTSGEIHAGDGFTIFDIGGFTGFGAIAAGWTASAAPFGSIYSPPGPLGPDTALMNVTFTYRGAPMEVVFGATTFVPFVVLTTGTTLVTDNWVSKDHLIGTPGIIDGAMGPGDRGNILVPAVATVPDGGVSAILLGLGLLAVGGTRRLLGCV